ncbi:MAG: ABC transporter ATP-binding protein [Ferruginibacter sp.]|nr:ABC transporter ATP-binding protein [Ferruginibacter sp.]
MSAAIQVEKLSKIYRLGEIGTGTLSHDLQRWWAGVRGKEDPFLKIGETNRRDSKGHSQVVYSLRDINFSIEEGTTVGIIGRNGAGKSTLLKILSRVTAPTSGIVKIKGRIASLLEVGTGFHPEFTGRENIFLNGAILGMRKKEISRKLEEIVHFSGVERYIDTPVKRYSSGMYVRLAFAVAAHLESEILIVDEVLAVGDAEFQKKCLGRMGEVSKGEGRTVLFVSHNMSAVSQLCQNGILLSNGQVELTGNAASVIQQYFKTGYDNDLRPSVDNYRSYNNANSPVKLTDVFIKGFETVIPKLDMNQHPEIRMKLEVLEQIKNANVSVTFYNAEGVKVGVAFSWDDGFFLSAVPGLQELRFRLMNTILSPGLYTVSIGINQSTHTTSWDGIHHYPLFEIENQDNVKTFTHRSWGTVHLNDNHWELLQS